MKVSTRRLIRSPSQIPIAVAIGPPRTGIADAAVVASALVVKTASDARRLPIRLLTELDSVALRSFCRFRLNGPRALWWLLFVQLQGSLLIIVSCQPVAVRSLRVSHGFGFGSGAGRE